MIGELENLIRGGQFAEVEKRLRKMSPTKIKRQEAYAIANIARRINQPQLAVRILNPIVRPQIKDQSPATEIELIEYAESLRRLGALDEAWQLSLNIDAQKNPQVLIHQAFCLFAQWKYQESLPLLRSYIEMPGLTAYAQCMGEINLAAALIQTENLNEAEKLLGQLRQKTLQSEFLLLYGNSLELTSQLLIAQGDWLGALKHLDQSAHILKSASQMENLFVEKWKAIAESLQSQRVTAELRQLPEKSKAAKHWETQRECELYIAHLENNSSLFSHLYFGTPYESYRRRIQKFAGSSFSPATSYAWSDGGKPRALFDLARGSIPGNAKSHLPMGQTLHRFLIRISSDFYRPLPVLSAFGALFPDEFMNATASPNRIHQIVKRCREWIEEQSLDMKISEIDGGYQISPGRIVGLQVPREALPLDQSELEWLLVKNNIAVQEFTSRDIAGALNCSVSSAQKLLQWALQHNKVEKSGKAQQTVYSFTPRG